MRSMDTWTQDIVESGPKAFNHHVVHLVWNHQLNHKLLIQIFDPCSFLIFYPLTTDITFICCIDLLLKWTNMLCTIQAYNACIPLFVHLQVECEGAGGYEGAQLPPICNKGTKVQGLVMLWVSLDGFHRLVRTCQITNALLLYCKWPIITLYVDDSGLNCVRYQGWYESAKFIEMHHG